MSNFPRVNLGQSNFQDAMFVVGAMPPGYRKLRQIELEMRSLEDAIKQHEFTARRNSHKLMRMDLKIDETKMFEEEELEREEYEWAYKRAHELLEDATIRLAQFVLMRKQCIAERDQTYWDSGFEAAEVEYWPQHFGKQLALELAATQTVSPQLISQIAMLDSGMKRACLLHACEELPKFKLDEELSARLMITLAGEAPKQLG